MRKHKQVTFDGYYNDKRSMSVKDLIKYIIDVRTAVCPTSMLSDEEHYYKLCAINELVSELNSCYPWENWKEPKEPNVAYAQLEAADVFIFMVAIVSMYNFSEGSLTLFEYSDNYPIEFGKLLTEEPEPNWGSWLCTLNHDLIRCILDGFDASYTSNNFMEAISILAELAQMDEFAFCTTVFTKIEFIKHRFSNGRYVQNWNKNNTSGDSENVTLIKILKKYMENECYNLEDLSDMIRTGIVDFVY